MLQTCKLSLNKLLLQSGWKPTYKIDLEQRYDIIENQIRNFSGQHPLLHPQVPLEEVFPAARDIIESLNGIMIENMHPELELGQSCHIIEFDYFEYDTSNGLELQVLANKIGKRMLFIGIGYEIIGDWLVDEEGFIYFRNKIQGRLHFISKDIYDFLDRDIYKLTDRQGS